VKVFMSRVLTLSDDLFDRLRGVADQRGLSVEELLDRWLAALAPSGEPAPDAGEDDDLLTACTHALLNGGSPPVSADWKEIETVLERSEPSYPTIEEAMSALRSRPWSKDE
jgi:hypothetical protein